MYTETKILFYKCTFLRTFGLFPVQIWLEEIHFYIIRYDRRDNYDAHAVATSRALVVLSGHFLIL